MDDNEARKIFLEAKRHFANQEYDLALPMLRDVAEHNKNFADLHNMLGVILHNEGQFSDAIQELEKALKINPNYTEAMMNLSVLYNDLGEYKKARKLFEKVKKKSKNATKAKMDPSVRNKLANQHNLVGDTYRGIGFYKEAIAEYDKALDLAAKFNDIRLKKAICLRESKQYTKSLREFNVIVKANPKFIDAKIQRGLTYFVSNKKKEAQAEWKKILKANPKHDGAQMYLKLAADEK